MVNNQVVDRLLVVIPDDEAIVGERGTQPFSFDGGWTRLETPWCSRVPMKIRMLIRLKR